MEIYCCTGTAGREANFEDKKHNFEGHARKLADTANMVATAGGCRNKKTVEEIFKASKQVCFTVLQFNVEMISTELCPCNIKNALLLKLLVSCFISKTI
jgi:hypothetical protein